MSTIPIIILIFAHFLSGDEKINTKKSIGIALGVFGTVLLISSKSGGTNGDIFSLGEQIFVWLCILAPFCYASGAIVIKRSVQSDYLEFSTHSLLIASLISAPILFTGELPTTVNVKSIIAILYLGIFPTGIATIILVSLIKNDLVDDLKKYIIKNYPNAKFL